MRQLEVKGLSRADAAAVARMKHHAEQQRTNPGAWQQNGHAAGHDDSLQPPCIQKRSSRVTGF